MAELSLSIVVASHEMARELPRTILSLLPPYQRGLDGSTYEIIIVDNGSQSLPDVSGVPKAGVALRVECFAPSSPSPAAAINHGLSLARGALVGVWIDGARLASPGLLSACLAASGFHPQPVIATLNYQLGSERQYLSADRGYDQLEEDRLLGSIGWPAEGYRLFDIAVPEAKDPEGRLLESNALFLRRTLWDALGGYDVAFSSAGGGFVNPDMLSRAAASPGSQLIRILGEATFHQYHGGLTTGGARRAAAATMAASREYLALRGRPPIPVRTAGWIYDAHAKQLTKQGERK